MALGKARAWIGRPWMWVVVGLLALYYVLEVQGYRSLFYTPGDRFPRGDEGSARRVREARPRQRATTGTAARVAGAGDRAARYSRSRLRLAGDA